MNKVLIVARNEYLIAVTSKAFLVGVALMPIFMGGAIVVQYLTRDQVDISPRRLVIVDQTGRLFDSIAKAAEVRNENAIYSSDSSKNEGGSERKQLQPKFQIEQYLPGKNSTDRPDVVLTERVKNGELFAFAIIEPNIFDAKAGASVRYHSQSPSYHKLANWLRMVVNQEIKRVRIAELGLSPESVAALSNETQVRQFGLVETTAEGEIIDAKEEDRLLTFAVPFAGMMLMFMMIMTIAPTMLNNVLEEKMQKISEFLISSISSFQLMLGKLVGAVGIGLTLSTIYLGAAYGLAYYFGINDKIPISLYAWFVFFLFVALLIFGSIFSAIGAACSEIKDAQSLMTPIMMMAIIPMMCMGPIMNSPSSFFAKAISLFPPATPMLMFARIAIPPGPATWEIVLGTVLVILFAVGCVWAAGKVFRIGILSQGQAPSMAKLVQWVLTK